MKLRTFAVIALALAACGAQGAEKYYKWKDEGGAWHYTRTPPPAGAPSGAVCEFAGFGCVHDDK